MKVFNWFWLVLNLIILGLIVILHIGLQDAISQLGPESDYLMSFFGFNLLAMLFVIGGQFILFVLIVGFGWRRTPKRISILNLVLMILNALYIWMVIP